MMKRVRIASVTSGQPKEVVVAGGRMYSCVMRPSASQTFFNAVSGR